jgi:hypothetical protein
VIDVLDETLARLDINKKSSVTPEDIIDTIAVKFDKLKWSNEPVKSTSSSATTTTGSAQSQAKRDRNYPDHAVLDATKDQLRRCHSSITASNPNTNNRRAVMRVG